MKFSDLFKFLTELVDEALSAYEDKRKNGKKRPLLQVPLCETEKHCHVVFEYRADHMVYLRCTRCMRVHKKRPMDAREMSHYHDRLIASIIDVKSQKARSKAMENDGTKFLNTRERDGHVAFCEGVLKHYHEDQNVQFHLLDDFELLEYVEAYKFDQGLKSCLDEPISK